MTTNMKYKRRIKYQNTKICRNHLVSIEHFPVKYMFCPYCSATLEQVPFPHKESDKEIEGGQQK